MEVSNMKKMKLIALAGCMILLVAALPLSAGEGERAFVGIYPGDIWNYEDAGVEYGIIVNGVIDDTPAQEAGMLSKDIILEMDGTKIFNHDQFTKMLKMYKPGQKVKFKIYRDGDEKTIKLTLANKADFEPKPEYKAYLGVYLSDMDEKDYEKKGLNTNYGVLISDIVKEGPSAEVGILGGDILLDLDGQHVYTPDQISKMLEGMEPDQSVTADIFRDGEYKTFTIVLGKKEVSKAFFGEFDWFEKPSNVYVWNYKDKNGKWLGLQVDEIDDDGLVIEKIYEGSPAEGSLLQEKDIIVKINGISVDDVEDISGILDEVEIDAEVVVEVLRDGEILNVTTTVGEKSDLADQLQISIDKGLMKMYIDGEEKKILDLENVMEKIEKGFDEGGIKLDSLQEKLKKLNIDVLRIEDSGAI
ncbi:MAG TPA: PDZ domain-containing protein [Candidatus Cloacimonetes bacterium]|nr:PDZ domain-containing protein [Candidatus Cloacimonadota bacterium]